MIANPFLLKIARLLSSLAVLIFIASCARFQNRTGVSGSSQTPGSPGQTHSTEGTLSTNGVTRQYRFYLPSSYPENAPVALVINFQGLGANSLEQEALKGI